MPIITHLSLAQISRLLHHIHPHHNMTSLVAQHLDSVTEPDDMLVASGPQPFRACALAEPHSACSQGFESVYAR